MSMQDPACATSASVLAVAAFPAHFGGEQLSSWHCFGVGCGCVSFSFWSGEQSIERRPSGSLLANTVLIAR